MPNQSDRDPTVVVVTLPDVYAEVKSLSGRFENFMATYEERERHRADHETRLQRLERRALPITMLLAVSGLGAGIGGLL